MLFSCSTIIVATDFATVARAPSAGTVTQFFATSGGNYPAWSPNANSFDVSKGRCGSPRIMQDLREQGERVSRKRVIRLKQDQQHRVRQRSGSNARR